ncbi:MAG: acyl-[ACP]--phospholipid O-acyltransferase [Alphaproteobacteria bacterium]|nr:acyl-[ACP]--phospholipid O-acyltransferase [Alphaproteobacteria bacterium]
MSVSFSGLLKSKRFLPFFLTQFFGAFNDNVFKKAMEMLIIYGILASSAGLNKEIMVPFATLLFMLPFFLFSATAGQVAEKFDKAFLIRVIKLSEIAIMLMAVLGFIWESIYFLLFVLFLMGTQSAFFGPIKYAILPEQLKRNELVGGNALVGAGTYIAILLGAILGVVALQGYGEITISALVVCFALMGWYSSTKIPECKPSAPNLKINLNFVAETKNIIKHAAGTRAVFLSILGISWFWLYGSIYLTQFSAYAESVLKGDEYVATLFLMMFTVGISIGSVLCKYLLDGEISAKYVPIGALGMTYFAGDLFFASSHEFAVVEGALMTVGAFASTMAGMRILFDLLMISVCAGVYIVPLVTIMQTSCKEDHRSRVIAANNIVNAMFIVVGAVFAMLLLKIGFSIPQLFLVVAIANIFVTIYICGLLPEALIKVLLATVFKVLYRVDIKGRENIQKTKGKAVIVVNHTSFLDAALLAAFMPGKLAFAVNTHIAKKWWVRPFMRLVDCYPLDPTNPMSIKSLVRSVEGGKRCVIFPEGRITVTGALMKVYEGPAMIADKANAPVIPIRIDGAQFSKFSRLRGKLRLRWFPKIDISVLEPITFKVPKEIVGRKRREVAGIQLYDVMADMMFSTCDTDKTLFRYVLEARKKFGGKFPIIEDVERCPISYNKFLLGSLVIGRKLAKVSNVGEYVGVLLPNTSGAAVTFFGLQAFGRVPAMLNYSTGLKNIQSACAAAQIKTIVTSRRFVSVGKLDNLIEGLSENVRVVYLEDIKSEVWFYDKLCVMALDIISPFYTFDKRRSPDDASVVLFTSGSEGAPKGVVLSHRNIISNCLQMSARIDFNQTDKIFNAMPMFHSFGLTAGALLPILSGIKLFLYPSPLHYRIVPEVIYDTCATIMFGTDTFLTGYAKVAHPYDFFNVRYVFAGAEKVKDETRVTWMNKFGVRILEGYGATETAPVISINTPMHYKARSVGRLLPGIEYKLKKVSGIDSGGRLFVKGANIMLGYLRAENPGVLEAMDGGWYDTGDIVNIDKEDGFITISGRAKRFVKIAGEMVSLTAAEALVASVWPDNSHAVVGIPDAKKGEQLVLVTDKPRAGWKKISEQAQKDGVSELMVPKNIMYVKALPVLGTGKLDYVAVQELALK